MNHEILGSRIREERIKHHLTQEKLAEEVQLSTAYIGQIERNERSLTLENLVIIANRLNVTVDSLLSPSLTTEEKEDLEIWLQLTDGRSLEEKLLAINMIEVLFRSLDYMQ
ncbi:helix-turn-helix domain-containing protein [Velocimicrobium porci]|uniref:Helix-turn-helix transcriptional regulator n=1 Tax=Velocimicrobium porci TaxID=2606634 RepID=A0A6L5Y3J9_9FIRM|nr:helix-turn-helix transcriptional regulator [Velocimicrobium porci]MSS64938.1 helix-turn-helix transcriptional regulator [Velocimicrobium porci]